MLNMHRRHAMAVHARAGVRSRHRLGRIVVAMAVAVAAMLAAPAQACGCGALFPEDEVEEVSATSERAIVQLADGVETITMKLGVLTDGASAGLVVPTPAPATVTEGNERLYELVEEETRAREVIEWHFLPREWFEDDKEGGVGAPGGAPDVTVLDEVQLGPISATTLDAATVGDLRTWLGDNGYVDNPDTAPILRDYIDRGWSFVALQLTAERSLEGELAPIQLTFETQEPVYPLALSQLATERQDLELAVLADGPRAAMWHTATAGYEGSMEWSAAVQGPELATEGAWLTTLDMSFDEPAQQVRGDLLLQDTGNRTEIVDTWTNPELIMLWGIPAFVWLAVALLAALVMGVVALVRRRNRHAAA